MISVQDLGWAIPRRMPRGRAAGSPFPRDQVAAAQLHHSGAGRHGIPPRCISSLSSL